MSAVPSNKEALLHRIFNQRRIAHTLIEQSRFFLKPGIPFSSELAKEFKKQGNFGSKDRKLYRELIFTYIRYRKWIDEFAADKNALLEATITLATPTREIQNLYPSLSDKSFANPNEPFRHRLLGFQDSQLSELLPDWFLSHINKNLSDTELHCIFQRPPLWLRVQNGDPVHHLSACQTARNEGDRPCALLTNIPDAIDCPPDLSLSKVPAYANGSLEVQDISSQLLLHLLPGDLKGKWLDACAGAGGKTLQLAKMLGSEGTVTAFDLRLSALRELELRKKRAKISNIQITTTAPEGDATFDGVLVDAPCSGSGTWRRHPFLKEQTVEETVMSYSKRQGLILSRYSENVKVGGILAYATCSLSRFENEHVVEAFLKSHKLKFEYIPLKNEFNIPESGMGTTLFPHHFNGDGLFIAAFRRIN